MEGSLRERVEEAVGVGELISLAQDSLDQNLGGLWVTGEVFEYRGPHRSGHYYFKLRDESATLEVKMWKGVAASGLQCTLEEGRKVRAFGRFDIWPVRGNLSFVLQRVEDDGVGDLAQQFERLKKQLSAEGLFEESAKQVIPRRPRTVALLTAEGSAAEADILRSFEEQKTPLRVWRRPIPVQGAAAVGEIIRALEECAAVSPDVILLARGGGSLEDLWTFNEEPLIRALAACPIPVVSAIGHETDFTLADFVADARVKTPTAGALELCLGWTRAREDLRGMAQEWHHLGREWISGWEHRLERLTHRVHTQTPKLRLDRALGRLREAEYRLSTGLEKRLMDWRHRLDRYETRFQGASPDALLKRGYALVEKEGEPGFLRSSQNVEVGQKVRIRLAQGSLRTTVNEIENS